MSERLAATERHPGPDGTHEPTELSDAGPRGPGGSFQALRLALWALKAGPAFMLAIVVAVAAVVTPLFLTTSNLGNVIDASAVIAVIAMGQLLVIVTRGIDLSVGSIVALSSVVGALVFARLDSGVAVIAAILATGLVVGLLNGAIYVFGRVPHPFIVTLATLSVVRGLALLLADGRSKYGMPDAVVFLGGGSIG